MIVVKLSEIAEQKNYSRKDVHLGTGLSYPTVFRYWNDDVQQIDKDVLDKFCDFLDCDPGDLVKRVKNVPE